MIDKDDDIFLDNEVEDIISQIKNQTKSFQDKMS